MDVIRVLLILLHVVVLISGTNGQMDDRVAPGLPEAGGAAVSPPKGNDGKPLAADANKPPDNFLPGPEKDIDLLPILKEPKTASGPPKKSVRRGRKIYMTNGTEANYNDALAICLRSGGQLATPLNPVENHAILSLRRDYAKNAYLGISDLQTPGVFRYLTGEAIRYTNWSPSEPNYLTEEFCVEMYDTGKWNNKLCERTALVICEDDVYKISK